MGPSSRSNVSISRSIESIKVYIDGLLHLHIPRDKYVAFQSWVWPQRKFYVLEIYLKDSDTMIVEYDKREMFEEVIQALDVCL